MQLLTIKSPQENLEVVLLGRELNLEWVWTAATDLGQSRRWVWATDGQLVKEFHWAEKEPGDKKEHCVEAKMDGFPSNWNDNDCKKIRPFICEEVVEGQEDDEDEEDQEEDDGGVEYEEAFY